MEIVLIPDVWSVIIKLACLRSRTAISGTSRWHYAHVRAVEVEQRSQLEKLLRARLPDVKVHVFSGAFDCEFWPDVGGAYSRHSDMYGTKWDPRTTPGPEGFADFLARIALDDPNEVPLALVLYPHVPIDADSVPFSMWGAYRVVDETSDEEETP